MQEHEQERTFDDWLSRHKGVLFKVLHAYAFTPHDREDLFQEIITQVWNSIPRFRGDAAVTTWLYRVALNCALAWARKERKHRDRMESGWVYVFMIAVAFGALVVVVSGKQRAITNRYEPRRRELESLRSKLADTAR